MNLIYITLLPDDIILMLWNDYIHLSNKVWINKENYNKYHYLIYYLIIPEIKYIKKYDQYVRDMIRLDYIFVMKNIIQEQIENWLKPKRNIKYRNIIFPRYINYINYLINKYNSGKIKNEIIKTLKERKCEKIWQENYITVNNKWNGV